jgi:hypothetical protein
MYKRILATVIGLLAFAAVPAMASASPVLKEGTTTVPVGSSIQGTNSGNILLTTGSGIVTCTGSTLGGTLTTNGGTSIAGDINSASFTGTGSGGTCTSTFFGNPTFSVTPEHLPWCITSTTLGSFTVRGGGCSAKEEELRFTLTNALVGECTYERPKVIGTYVANVTPVKLTVGSGQTFTRVAGGGLCPSTGTLSGGWTLETGVSPFTGLQIS